MEIWHRNNKKLAFFPETLNSFEINDYTNKILTLLNFGATDGEIMKQTDSSKKRI